MYDWTLEGLAALVGRMRTAQRRFYRNRRRASPDEHHALLRESIDLERDVDRALEEIGATLPLFDRTEPGS
jgi:hypothetical protein